MNPSQFSSRQNVNQTNFQSNAPTSTSSTGTSQQGIQPQNYQFFQNSFHVLFNHACIQFIRTADAIVYSNETGILADDIKIGNMKSLLIKFLAQCTHTNMTIQNITIYGVQYQNFENLFIYIVEKISLFTNTNVDSKTVYTALQEIIQRYTSCIHQFDFIFKLYQGKIELLLSDLKKIDEKKTLQEENLQPVLFELQNNETSETVILDDKKVSISPLEKALSEIESSATSSELRLYDLHKWIDSLIQLLDVVPKNRSHPLLRLQI